jgi:CubicO group peptidase (beta-lactamase class C family)
MQSVCQHELLKPILKASIEYACERELLNSLAVGVITPDGPLTWYSDSSVNDSSWFEIGSATKTYTAELVASLINDRLLYWNQPLSDFLPEAARNSSSSAAIHSATLLDLATHQSGLPSLAPDHHFANRYNFYGDYKKSEVFGSSGRLLAAKPLYRNYLYSNLGYALLGAIAGQVCHSSYADALNDRILKPFGLLQTRLSMPGNILPPVIGGHSMTGRPRPRWTQQGFAPAGALIATLPDVMLWLSIMLGNTSRPTLQVYPGSTGIGWDYHLPSGFFKRTATTGGFCAYFSVHPRNKTAVAIISNRDAKPLVADIAQNVELTLVGLPINSLSGNYCRVRDRIRETVSATPFFGSMGRMLKASLRNRHLSKLASGNLVAPIPSERSITLEQVKASL